MKKNNSGFSLVELIIVIAIMAVLIGILAPQFLKYVERSRQATDMQNLQSLKTAIEVYVADKGDATNCEITVTGGANGTIAIPAALVGEDLVEGVSASSALKSKTWPAGPTKYTYSMTTGWGDPAACKNTAKPEYDMADVFK